MSRKPVVAVIGSGRDIEPAISNARKTGKLIAKNGWVLITGGRDAGVMKAASEGAKQIEGSLTVGILPDRISEASPAVDVAIISEMGQARNNMIVLSADVVIACGVEGSGTASEVALAIKNGKPVILLGAGEEARRFFVKIGGEQVHPADSPENVIRLVKKLLPKATGVADSRQKPYR